MDVVGVSQHAAAAQDIPIARFSSSGLHGKVVLDHEHVGGGEGLGESFFQITTDMLGCSLLSRSL